ncbi:MAG: BON domain-containing protein, partial [Bacteroidetes bacterium]|nr:BON domain-containing protein [Bacteroidota bacterium]
IVRKLSQVKSVHNEIRISTPGSFLSTTNDTWLTTKAKSLMLAEKDFSSHHIKVYSENGEIFLMGLVTKAEADKAIAIVRNIDGVERVVQLFEYIQ